MESTSYILCFRVFFFYLVTTSWIFYISLYENSFNQSINIIVEVNDNDMAHYNSAPSAETINNNEKY